MAGWLRGAPALSLPATLGVAHGLFMWRDSDGGERRYLDYVARYGHAPEQGTFDEQLDDTMVELRGSEGRAWSSIQRAGDSPGGKAAAVSRFYERQMDTEAEESRRWDVAPRLTAIAAGDSGTRPATAGNGTVRVDMHLHNAPSGTNATAVGTEAVIVTPPNIQTSMPLAH